MDSKSGGNLKISLIRVSHVADCNLQILFLETWNLVKMYEISF